MGIKAGVIRQEQEIKMPVKVIIGAQWGDEGKGKLVDVLSENVDIVARY